MSTTDKGQGQIKAYDGSTSGRGSQLPETPINTPSTFTSQTVPITGMTTEKESMMSKEDQVKADAMMARYVHAGEKITALKNAPEPPTAFHLEQTRENGAADDARQVMSEQSKLHIFGLATTGALLIAIACAFRR